MKATLEFDLPDDDMQYRAAVHAQDISLALWDIEQTLRSYWKHGEFEHDETHRVVGEIWERYHDITSGLGDLIE